MKLHVLFLVACTMLVVAGMMVAPGIQSPSNVATHPAEIPTGALTDRGPTAVWTRSDPGPKEPLAARPVSPEEEAALTAWQKRFRELQATYGDPSEASLSIGLEIGRQHDESVADGIVGLLSRPPAERYDELATIRKELTEGIAMICDRLELEGSARDEAAGPPLDRLDAEIQYAEAAPDPERRLALLQLDRERLEKMTAARAVSEAAAQEQTIREIDQWYDLTLGRILGAEAPEFPPQDVAANGE